MESRVYYPKDQVYPASGGEFQLEQLRAMLPQYKVTIVEDDSCVDMEMTVAYTANISTMIPSSGTREDCGFSRMSLQDGAGESWESSSSTSTVKDEPNFRDSDVLHNQDVLSAPPSSVPPFPASLSQSAGFKGHQENLRPNLENERGLRFGAENEVGRRANQENEFGRRPNMENEQRLRFGAENEIRPKTHQENDFSHRSNLENEHGKRLGMENEIGRRANQENERGICRPNQENLRTYKQQESFGYGHPVKASAQENSSRQNKHQSYGFTPNTVQGAAHIPSAHPVGVSTKLNFSEVDSSVLSTSSSHQHSMQAASYQGMDGSILSTSKTAPRKHLAGFNVSSDLEAKAKVLMEAKQNSENEFAMTEFEIPKKPGQLLKNRKVLGTLEDDLSYQDNPPQAIFSSTQESFSVYADSMVSADESSFVPFQDASCVSIRVAREEKLSKSYGENIPSKEHGALFSHSYGGKGAFVPVQSKPIGKPAQLPTGSNRKVLQELPVPPGAAHVQQQSEYAGQQSSFSMYGANTQDESSFLPYYDASNISVSTLEKPPPPAPPPSRSNSIASAVHQSDNLPPTGLGGGAGPALPPSDFLETTFPQVTQFDIKHPMTYDPSSTPASHKPLRDLTINLSVISADDAASSRHYTQPLISKPVCLSTITEESSGKSKLTVSSSRSRNTTNTTSSSTNSLGSYPESDLSAVIVDPFVDGTVNRMLNRLGGLPPDLVEEMAPEESLCIVEGECLQLGGMGVVYDSMTLLPQKAEYPRSTMYQCSSGLNTPHMLQIFKSGGEWAVTAAYHCQNRLLKMGLSQMAEVFPEYQQVCLYQCPENVTITVSHYHRFGSLMDFLEYVTQHKVFLTDVVVIYLCAGMLGAVAALHKAGFLHTNISPRHFLLHDFSDPKFLERLCAVRLIDLRHCVDTNQFSEDQFFTGSPATQPDPHAWWRSPVMKEKKPWKWQVDYYSLAASILTLVQRTVEDPRITYDSQTGRYCSPKLGRSYDIPLWHNLLDQLLNAESWVDLDQLKARLLDQVTASKIKSHFSFLCKKI